MKKNIRKRCVSCLMSTVMITALLSGCGGNSQQAAAEKSAETAAKATTAANVTEAATVSAEEKAMYPIEGDVTLTLAIKDMAAVTSSGAKNVMDTPLGEAWQKATGVNIDVIQMAGDDAFSLMFAGGELPDIIGYRFDGYSGGAARAIEDGIILPLNDYVEYCPDLMEVLNSNEDYYRGATTNGGLIIGAPFVRSDALLRVQQGFIIRKDMLDKVGKDLPVTVDDLYEILVAFRDELGVEAPLSMTNGYLKNTVKYGAWSSAFGQVTGDFYQKDGVVYCGYAENEYKDLLTFLNKLYGEKLLDNNFQALDTNTQRANFMNGKSGITFDLIGGGLGGFLSTMEDDPEFDATGFASLVAKEGDRPYSSQTQNSITGYYFVVTPDCKDVEAAVKFLNYCYTEEGTMLLNYGIEGESYEIIDGVPTYTELITKNPNGLTMQQALAQYTLTWDQGPLVQQREYIEQYAGRPQQQETLKRWVETDVDKYRIPTFEIPEEYVSEYSRLTSDIDTYRNEMLVRYVTGDADLANYESEYLATLNELGIERLTEIVQIGLDAYNAR